MGGRVPPESHTEHRKWDRFGNRKINNAIWEVRNNHEQRAIARDILVTQAGKEIQGRRLHELDSIGILIGPSTSSLTFDASSSESSVGKRGCGLVGVLTSASP